MASGSQFMTTYYAKRIMGDNAASTADQALLQTGYGITTDTWILNRTNRPNYGILYHYDSNGADKIKFIGGINNTNDIEAAWIQLDAGDTYILGRVGIGEDPTINNNPYKLYINGTTYANAPVYINNSTAVAMEDDNGALVIGDKAGLNIGIDNCKVHARDNSAAADLLLNSEGGNILLGVDDDDYYVNIRSEQDASSTITGALRVGGGAGIAKKLYVGDDIHSDGHLYFAAAKNIYMNYNGVDYPILENSDDSNIILNAAAGILNIGHKNTIGINMYYSTDDSTRTQFFTINSNGAYANTRFGVNGQDTNYTLYVNGTGYLEDDLYIQGANNGIYFVGTQATYQMIKFIDNSSDAYGNGISIGGGGQTIIGGGESANTAAAQAGTSGSEIMYVCNDGNVDIISNLQNGWDSRKVMTLNTSGYLMLPSYINSPTSNNENPTVSQFIVTNGSDHYYRKSSTTHAMEAIRGAASGSWGINITGSAGSATYASSYLANRGSVSGSDHAAALKAYFNSYKASEPRNALVAHYSSASGNGSLCMGYFLSGYDSNPYGGFFVCHYNNPYYVGIQNGTYTQQHILTSTNYTSYTVTKTGTGASGSWAISVTGSSASCTGNSNTANYQNCVAGNEIRYARNGNMSSAASLWQGWAFAEGKVAVINDWRFGNGNGGLAPIYGSKIYNAVWNDFAEYRVSDITEGGRVLVSDGKGHLILSTKRLQPSARVISDTFGCSVGMSDSAKTPIGVAGRVLVYPYQPRENYKVGDALCAAPNGTADIMTREEIIQYPDRIIGIVDEVPDYEIWDQIHTNKKDDGEVGEENHTNIKVKGRIWIYVR